jgi:predicted ribosomally synthesized peptide with SipW-like signal peptide
MNLRKILLSVFSIGVVALVAVIATSAFFSDTETSTGNTFVAGAIDLKIGNASYVDQGGGLVENQKTSWELTDLTIEKFFDFIDLKPGDWGEDTIGIEVNSNEAWLCAAIDITANDENGATDPELEEGDSPDDPENLFDGELASQLQFFFWVDDGDNVYEEGEKFIAQGYASELLTNPVLPLQDSENKLFEAAGGIMPGETYHIGKIWCFGELDVTPADGTVGEDDLDPIDQQHLVTCNGEPVNNMAQTDLLRGDITFYAEQTRHNEDFVCSKRLGSHRLLLENKNDDWEPIIDARHGVLSWKGNGPTFDFSNSLYATGLTPNTGYSLIYYADPWPGNHPGALLGEGTSNADGNLTIKGNVNLGHDLPHPTDANVSDGAKIWLVLSSDYNPETKSMVLWNPSEYLFEYNLINYIYVE